MAQVCVLTNNTGAIGLYLHDPHAREQSVRTRDAVCRALIDLGHAVTLMKAGPHIVARLARERPEVVFNLATGFNSKKDQANIAALLELTGIPFTGSDARAHLIGLHKHLAKMVMGLSNVPTPRFRLMADNLPPSEGDVRDLTFPVIVKPAAEGSSAGISPDSVATDPRTALDQAMRVYQQFGPPVLIEEFIDGREFTVGVVGYPEPDVLPVEEIEFQHGGMFTYDVKTRDAVRPVCPAEIPESLATTLQTLALKTFRAVGCRDLARVDVRVDADGRPYVLEINTLPGLMPGYSEIVRMSEAAGMSYKDLIATVLEGALSRSSVRESEGTRKEAHLQWVSQ